MEVSLILTRLREGYENRYILFESLGCIIFPAGMIYLNAFAGTGVYNNLLLLLLALAGIIWMILFASLLGKALFTVTLLWIYLAFPGYIAGFVIALALARFVLLWYTPLNYSASTMVLARGELLNRWFDSRELDYSELAKKSNLELIKRLVAAKYIDKNKLLHLAQDEDNYPLVDLLLEYGADPTAKAEKNEDFIKKAVIKGDLAQIKTALTQVEPEGETGEKKDTGDHQDGESYQHNHQNREIGEMEFSPNLQPVFYDELSENNTLEDHLNLTELYQNKTNSLDLEGNYIELLKEDSTFWIEKFKKLFTGKVKISSIDTGYLMVISKHEYLRKSYKDSKVSREEKSTESMHVGELRLKDKLEEELLQSFQHPQSGTYTFPSGVSPIPCDVCGGRGLKDCPAGCEGGRINCFEPECKQGFMKCYECKGKGRITGKCPDCENGYKKCSRCKGRGFIVCDSCYGRGSVLVEIMEECPCDVQWKVKCPECQGKGRQKGYICQLCGGEGLVCSKCNNKGQKPGDKTTDMSCNKCNETGKLEHCNCETGWLLCPSCNGKGEVDRDCYVCSGNGGLPCTKCKGTQKVNCSTCKGFGKVSCDSCQGAGKMYEIIYTTLEYRKNRRREEINEDLDDENDGDDRNEEKKSYELFLPEKDKLLGEFKGFSPEYLDEKCRGHGPLIRIIARERIRELTPSLKTSYFGFNDFLEKNSSDKPGVFMEVIDVMPVKYDIVQLSDGDELIIINEKDRL